MSGADSRDSGRATDPIRGMELLWGIHKTPTRGPKPGLSVERIVAAAVDLADREGLAAVSMRKVADRLGVSAMSLYTYIPGKKEVLELMTDTVIGESVLGLDDDLGWREKLEAIARADWALYDRHPWLPEIPWAQSAMGPNSLDAYEQAISAVWGLGLKGREMIQVISLVAAYVRSAAMAKREAATAPSLTGESDDEWWLTRAPFLEEVWDVDRFPHLSSPEMQHSWEPASDDPRYFVADAIDAFEFGLARVLDGIERLIEGRRSRASEV